ncbi:hypothetical protein PR202_ga03723 [Eleusine coracana subsp. coracana]|uniref:Protein kinase domain-containing protein n=1 Tax=Eleusine coracana subsp. coracana TaxID=191504 RepID=A0AAV5BQ44_ELECO|nr:hypothetical protein PR202_ga03723 [Eleusine coracana subsp. coracana]
MTARIFFSNYTYSFPVNPGRMFVRLYFHPSTYGDYVPANANFGVAASNLTLLENFNASRIALTKNVDFFFSEFSVNITSGRLEITFAPSTQQNGSYAFINGIEILPTPDLFTTPTPTIAISGNTNPFPVDPAWGFQTMYRLNDGGDDISPRYDADFYRSWRDDTPYVYGAGYGITFKKDNNVTIRYTPSVPKYIAPVDVYATARSMGPDARVNLKSNLTWNFLVDAGFYYPENSVAMLKAPHLEPNGMSVERKLKGAAPAVISGAVGGFVALIISCIAVFAIISHPRKSRQPPLILMRTILLGKGGIGNVFCGTIYTGIKAAIKRGNPVSQQGLQEFRTEIETLSLLRHHNLVSLIGYCKENNEMILVYDYMANGTLREHLYDTKKSPLPWRQRLDLHRCSTRAALSAHWC